MVEEIKEKKINIQTSSLRAYTMFGALVLICIFFHFATSSGAGGLTEIVHNIKYFFSFDWISTGIFLTPRNLSNLMLQMSVTGIIAVGMLMVIVAGQIDLSVGSVLGLSGGCAAIVFLNSPAVKYLGMSPDSTWLPIVSLIISVLVGILIGVVIGLFQGSLVAYANIPAFIVTLGGLLAWRGAVKGITQSETIPVADANFKYIGQGYLGTTQIPLSENAVWNFNIGWFLAIIAILFVIFAAFRRAQSQKTYGLGEPNYGSEMLKTILPIGAIILFVFVMNAYEGIPVPVMILLAVALLGVFITNFTTFGRYLFAIGGNADAARLSGINTKLNILKVYALLGALTGIAALIFTARVGSAAPDAGTLKELDAIAACVIGGASLMGGRGTIFGACLGALIMASLDNGMSLLNVKDFMQDIIKGSILVAAVGLDMVGRKQS